MKIKHPRAKALEVARDLTVAFREHCLEGRFIFAGSLRRGKAEVGDIELVYSPIVQMLPDPNDLLGNPVPTQMFDVQLEDWLRRGKLSKRVGEKGGTAWGPANKLAVHEASGIGIDFFQASERNFWTLLVCRTGSAESNTRICNAAIARGQKWNPYRGFEDRLTGELLFVPDSEEALFAHVRLPYLQPKDRTL